MLTLKQNFNIFDLLSSETIYFPDLLNIQHREVFFSFEPFLKKLPELAEFKKINKSTCSNVILRPHKTIRRLQAKSTLQWPLKNNSFIYILGFIAGSYVV